MSKEINKEISKEISKQQANTLLNCPFCGGEARLQRKKRNLHGYYVICKSCGCRTSFYQYKYDSLEKLREQAIEVWNTRKPMQNIVERLEMRSNPTQLLSPSWLCREERINRFEGYRKGLNDAIEIVKEEGGV